MAQLGANAPELNLALKRNANESMRRLEAWWRCEIIDRPPILVTAPRPDAPKPPFRQFATLRERWMNVEYQVETANTWVESIYWEAGDSMPIFSPNLGPEIATAALGAPLWFTEESSWSEPILKDWCNIPDIRINVHNDCLNAILDMTRLGLERAGGRYLIGHMDIHPGGDLAASLRDPSQLCIDLMESPDEVMRLMRQIRPVFYELYNMQDALMTSAGQQVRSMWLPVCGYGKCYVPSCDFAALVSNRQFRQFFLPEILEEIEWLDYSVFHLDGPAAVRHLDDLLAIPKLNAIQFVPGVAESNLKWLYLFQRIQDAGKAIYVDARPDEIDRFMEGLRPEGTLLSTYASTPEEADAIAAKMQHWK